MVDPLSGPPTSSPLPFDGEPPSLPVELKDCLNQTEDHMLIVDLGGAENIKPRIRTIGREFVPLRREAVIV